ncbi:ATP-binding protein [Pseudonocardia halophobica]|uniref:ATP-binding protein n=1 Tax=Pseudonocardia halophobica TaxID=29401 RepID=UPI003D89F323
MGPTLVGRSEELAALLDACHGGPGRLVLVTGCAGSGKTTLLEELTRRVAEAGAVVGSGHAVPGGGPFRPVAEALVRVAPPALADEGALSPFRAVLARILPTWPPALAAGTHLVDPVVVLGEAVLALLRVLSTDRRTVLVLDDAQWADRDTLALLEYLAGGLREVAATLVVAARDDQAVPDALTALHRHARILTVALRPLPPAEVALLVRRTVGGELPPEAEEYVARVGEGVPLLVTELAAGLLESGSLVPDGNGWRTTSRLTGGLPPSHLALVHNRVAGLAPRARELVRTAAVLGPELDADLLTTVFGSDAAEVADALSSAVDAGLLTRNAAGDVRWRHALTCGAVLAGLTQPERGAIAARAAEALEDEVGVRRALVADLHARGGRPARAAALLLEEARDAVAAGALATAQEILERALVLAVGDPGLVVGITVERIQAFALATRTDEAIAAADVALPTATGADRTALAVAAARACVGGQRFDEAGRYLTMFGDTDDPRVQALAAHIALNAEDLDQALALATRAAGAAEQVGPPDVLCEALEVVGRALRRRDPATSVAAFERAERVAAGHGLTPWRIRALAELGATELYGAAPTGRIAEAQALALDAGMLGTATALDLQAIAMTVGAEGMVGVMSRAERCADRAGRLGLTGIQAHALMFAARGRVHAGRAGEADLLLDDVDRLVPSPLYRSERSHNRATDAWLDGDDERAARELDDCIALLRELPAAPPAPVWGEWVVLRTVCDPTDDGPRAELRESDVLVQAVNRAALAYADAVAAAHVQQVDPGLLLAEGDRLLVPHPFLRHWLRIMLVARAVDGRLGDAPALLREAHAWLLAHGENRMARLCAAHLRRLGLPVPRPGRYGEMVPPRLRALGVTGRELEVLRLVAEGLGNIEIAGRLQLSRRTVETHVSNLLLKTGTRSREGLTGLAP